jgi:YgiT-type zinc finger domain-containing protein
MNICDICKGAVTKRKATRETPYHYTESGLSNVLLTGIHVYSCPNCAVEVADIPRMNELHLILAKELLLKPVATTGEEFRFLRKETRMRPKEFAERIGVDSKTVLNWEKAEALSRQNDVTVRFLVATELLQGKELQIVISRIRGLTESTWAEPDEDQTETQVSWREITELARANISLGISSWNIGLAAA